MWIFFEYKRMPFGLSNARGSFKTLMNQLCETELYKYGLFFLDDLVIYSKTLEEHADHIKRLLVTLRATNFRQNPKRCKFFQSQVDYLGYNIDQNYTQPDPKKIEGVGHQPETTTTTSLRSFLGFCNYYKWIVKDFAGIAELLTNQTKNNRGSPGTKKCSTCFEALKKVLITAPYLFHTDYNSPFIVDTDVFQELDYKFVHRTGVKHDNFDGISRQNLNDQLCDRLDGELEELVQTKPEPCTAGEAIERVKQSLDNCESFDPARTEETHTCQIKALLEAQRSDAGIGVFRKWTNAEKQPNQKSLSKRDVTKDEANEHVSEMLFLWTAWDRLEYKDDILYYRKDSAGSKAVSYLLVLPYKLRRDILGQMHNIQVSGGHMAVEKTLHRTRQRVWWPRMRSDEKVLWKSVILVMQQDRKVRNVSMNGNLTLWGQDFIELRCL